MRYISSAALAVLLACGDARPYPDVTLTVNVSGPGHVMVSGAVEARCAQTCELAVPRGADVTLTATARAGATFAGFDGACGGTDPCPMRLEEAGEASVTFDWLPLPPVTRYTWKRIDNGVTTYFRHLDSYGNAYGYRGGSASVQVPIRYDAVTERIEQLPGIDRAQVLAANDAGEVLMASLELGLFRYRDGASTVLAPRRERGVGARDLSEEGWVVGLDYADTEPLGYVPWVHDGVTGGIWGGGRDGAVASAIDSSGRVIGDLAIEERLAGGWTWVNYAALIERDRVELLPIGEPSTAQDLSDTGLVVGALRDVGIESRGFVFDLGTGELQEYMPLQGDLSLLFNRINPSGTVAVGHALDSLGQERPVVLFVGERRVEPLSSLVDLPANFLLRHAIAVNVHGQILVAASDINDDYDDDSSADLILTPE